MSASDSDGSPLGKISAGDGRPSWQVDVGVALLLLIVTIVVYRQTLACDFVNFDDPKYVSENPVVAGGISPRGIAYALTTFDVGNWIPLTWLSLELDASLFGIQARAFHATNLVLHAANVVLLYFVLRGTTRAVGRSAAVALLFAIHPLHVESVAWISERKDVLSTCLLLLTLAAYERYSRQPSPGRMALVSLLMGLGLLAKPMLVTLPILLILIDYWPLQRVATSVSLDDVRGIYPLRTVWELLVEKAPLFGLSLVDGIVTILAQRSTEAMSGTDRIPLAIRFANAISGCGWYLEKTIWPSGLCAFYPLPAGGTPGIHVWISAITVTALTAYAMYVTFRSSRRHALFGWLWFVVALLPVSGILQVGGQSHADRYTYVPHIGLFIFIVWEAERWLPTRLVGRRLGVSLCGAVAVFFAMITQHQIDTWRNSETLWTHALELDPENYGAHAMLGSLRMQEGKWDEAEQHVRRVLMLRPNFDRAIYQLGSIHFQRGEWLLAEECLLWVQRRNPQNIEAARDLEKVRLHLPNAKSARSNQAAPVREAADLNKQGLASARRGEMKAALHYFEQAIAVQPDYADCHNNAGLALNQLQRFDEAKQQFLQAIDLEPENGDFHYNLATTLVAQGNILQACEHLTVALRLKPHDVETRIRLEQLEKQLNRSEAE